MRNLLELTTMLSFIVVFGALVWAVMFMGAATEFNTDPVARLDRAEGSSRAFLVAGAALVIYIVSRFLRKRMD